MKIAVRLLIPLLVIALPLSSAVPARDADIRIGGGSTALGSMQLLAAAFEESHPDTRILIYPGIGSTGGLKAVADDDVDIGLMGRPLRDSEQAKGMVSIEYARTPMAFIAGRDVKVKALSLADIVKIYRGEKITWPNGTPIRLILYDASDNDTALLRQISPKMSQAVDVAIARPGMIFAASTQEAYDTVKQVPGSLAFCALTKVMTEKCSVQILSFNGVVPSVLNLNNGSYPLFKPLYLVHKSRPSSATSEFINFIRSAQGHRILEKSGDMPVWNEK